MLQNQVNAYIDYLKRSRHKSRVTKITGEQLNYFAQWCETQSIDSVEKLLPSTAFDYVVHLQSEGDLISGAPVSIRTTRERTTKLRGLFEWLEREDKITLRLSKSVPTIDKRGKANSSPKCTYNENLPA